MAVENVSLPLIEQLADLWIISLIFIFLVVGYGERSQRNDPVDHPFEHEPQNDEIRVCNYVRTF